MNIASLRASDLNIYNCRLLVCGTPKIYPVGSKSLVRNGVGWPAPVEYSPLGGFHVSYRG
jgi:hypothetical protein